MAPTLDETAAVMAAARAYVEVMHSSGPAPPASDLKRLLAELVVSVERVQAVTR